MAAEAFSNELLAERGVAWHALDAEEQDWTLADKVVELFEANDGATGYAAAATLVASLAKQDPSRRYRTSWRALEVWRGRRPARQAPAMPRELALAAVSWLLLGGRLAEATGVLLCFCALLRSSEALALVRESIQLQGNQALLLLGDTKRGQEQTVVVRNPAVVRWLGLALERLARKPRERVVGVSYGTLQRWLRAATVALGQGGEWSTHSLRRGGATALLELGYPPDAIQAYGRWLSARSAREYLRLGQVGLLRFRAAQAPAGWGRIRALAALGPAAFGTQCRSRSASSSSSSAASSSSGSE